ncbi:hypothetical protein [Arthrobacter sp. PM3]|uniref:hypothetical protein n=1 Tax=Arthrobacter sp. PM3 TaxID=2017685 RepID=UPI001ABF0C72|nr:hypothetical protein [Arthrobacter sp. PM3]
MRHMGISGKIAIGAFIAALALLVLTLMTLNETVFLWFAGASATAHVACVGEVVVRRRHKTLAASGLGSILFIAFGIAFLRQWGLAFNPDPDALSTRVDARYPDLYFYLSAAAGALTLLLLFAGTVLPGRARGRLAPVARGGRRPAPASRASGARTAGPRAAGRRTTARGTAARPAAPRAVARPATKAPVRSAAAKAAVKAPVKAPMKTPVKAPAKSPVKAPAAKTPARSSSRR